MSEDLDIAESELPRIDPDALRDESGHLNPYWVDRVRAHLESGDAVDLADLVAPLHASEMGDLLEALNFEERVRLVTLLGDKFDFSALTEVDDSVRNELIEGLPSADVARGVAELDNDDAVYILEDIDIPEREEILAQMPAFERLSLKRSLDFPEDSAGRLMQTDFIAIPPYLDGRPDHRLPALRAGPAGRFLPDLRRRPRPTTCRASSPSTSSCAPSVTCASAT